MSTAIQYELRNVTKSRGEEYTLNIPQLDVLHGEVLGLLGPTGAGKSTLLSLLAALEETTSGLIRFEGSSDLSTKLALTTRRRIAMVHQNPLMLSGTVRYNIEYGLRLRKRRKYEERVNKMLGELELTKFAAQSARTLSGGQVQLVALARALVTEPDILLLDEPTAHLDPAHVGLAEQVIRRYREDHATTIVWATHNLFQTRRVADRAALLFNGELVEVGPTPQFFADPSDGRTADFLQGRIIY